MFILNEVTRIYVHLSNFLTLLIFFSFLDILYLTVPFNLNCYELVIPALIMKQMSLFFYTFLYSLSFRFCLIHSSLYIFCRNKMTKKEYCTKKINEFKEKEKVDYLFVFMWIINDYCHKAIKKIICSFISYIIKRRKKK